MPVIRRTIWGLVKKLYELNADNVGAACRTDVLNRLLNTCHTRGTEYRFGVGEFHVSFGCGQGNGCGNRAFWVLAQEGV